MLTHEFRTIISRYVSSDINIDQLDNWYAPRLRKLVADPNSDNAKMAASIQLGLVDWIAGTLDEDNFRQQIAEDLRRTNDTNEG